MNFVHKLFLRIFDKINLSQTVINYIADVAISLVIIGLLFLFYFIIKKLVLASLRKIEQRTSKGWLTEVVNHKVTIQIIKLAFVIILASVTKFTPFLKPFYDIILLITIAFMGVSIVNNSLTLLNQLYEKYNSQAKSKPIRGILTVVKFFIFFITLIIVVSKLLGQNPAYLLTGLGAMSAIIMLIFKDSILGFVAGFQMATNDLVRIGDWIELPKYGADGDVIEISLSFVKIRNWDKTIVTIPSYALVSESFVNWRGMFDLGGRRIKRSINIDVSSVKFCSKELLKELSKIAYLNDYIKVRQQEIDKHNKERDINTDMPVNGRRLTNLGVFRIYIQEYLKNHPNIHKDMLLIVRQLQNNNTGVPLEIYAFTNDTRWVNYEGIASDIFDHLYAAIKFFELRVFQEPTGNDIANIRQN